MNWLNKYKEKHPARRCIFCGGNKVSREHLWSDWMAELFPEYADPNRVETYIVRNDKLFKNIKSETLDRPGLTFTKSIRAVCAPCNNGWMNTIEQAARPVLTPMFNSESLTLTEAMRDALATWCAMKFMVAEHMRRDHHTTPEDVRRQFMNTKVAPDFFRIWALRCGDGGWESGFSRNTAVVSLANKLPDGLSVRNTQSITWGVGDVLFYHTATLIPNLHFGISPAVDGLSVQLWPRIPDDIAWPVGRRLHWREGMALAESIKDSMRAPWE